jgi:hypothetical protein
MRMRHLRAEAGAAGVPAKMVKFIIAAGKIRPPDKRAISGGSWIKINDTHGVIFSIGPNI